MKLCPRFLAPGPLVWESWTWLTTTCTIQAWSFCLAQWRLHNVDLKLSGQDSKMFIHCHLKSILLHKQLSLAIVKWPFIYLWVDDSTLKNSHNIFYSHILFLLSFLFRKLLYELINLHIYCHFVSMTYQYPFMLVGQKLPNDMFKVLMGIIDIEFWETL